MKIGVLLSGCGVNDGSEIHEATLTLLHILKNGGTPVCIAPDDMQMHTVNHLKGSEDATNRNMMVEAARLTRGDITPLSDISAQDLDALMVPGGFGAAKNLSNFAALEDKMSTTVRSDVASLIQGMHAAGKPMGFMCIAPASVAAPALFGKKIKLTIGSDEGTSGAITALGNIAVPSTVSEVVIDETHNIASTPAYMLGENIADIELGIAKLTSWVCMAAHNVKAA